MRFAVQFAALLSSPEEQRSLALIPIANQPGNDITFAFAQLSPIAEVLL
jgi:hypothetical protein